MAVREIEAVLDAQIDLFEQLANKWSWVQVRLPNGPDRTGPDRAELTSSLELLSFLSPHCHRSLSIEH